MAEIVRTDDVLRGESRLEGTRTGIPDVYELVVNGGYSPVNIADQLDMTLSEIYTALAYYHEHPELDAERQSRHAPEPPHCR